VAVVLHIGLPPRPQPSRGPLLVPSDNSVIEFGEHFHVSSANDRY
jgi:hypothetical protein